jgi:molybdopterin molybdotransferase
MTKATMLTLDEALARLLDAVDPLSATEAELVSTFDALGRVLARDVASMIDVPPADNTSMDGYAVHAADVPEPGTVLPVSQRIPAGVVGQPLAARSAARIFTGAQVPPGADAIVMQEHCVALDHDVRIDTVPSSGQWIRRRGEDVRAGDLVLAAGTRMTPQAQGLAASVGAAELHVMRAPRVALFSTGDELVMPGQTPPERMPPGAIYNSNRFTLRGLLRSLGCEVTDLGIVPDRLDATRSALCEAAAGNDLIVTSGGVSVGDAASLRPAVQAEGQLDLWQVAIKPGKPLAFGSVRSDAGRPTLFMGLPGNPVSSLVTFVLTVRPVLLKLQGASTVAPRAISMRADFDWPKPDRRREFLRARINDAGGLDLFANQSSGVSTSAVWADGLIDNPPRQPIGRGDAVRFLPWAELLS